MVSEVAILLLQTLYTGLPSTFMVNSNLTASEAELLQISEKQEEGYSYELFSHIREELKYTPQ